MNAGILKWIGLKSFEHFYVLKVQKILPNCAKILIIFDSKLN